VILTFFQIIENTKAELQMPNLNQRHIDQRHFWSHFDHIYPQNFQELKISNKEKLIFLYINIGTRKDRFDADFKSTGIAQKISQNIIRSKTLKQ
jgi:hypothetical protein